MRSLLQFAMLAAVLLASCGSPRGATPEPRAATSALPASSAPGAALVPTGLIRVVLFDEPA